MSLLSGLRDYFSRPTAPPPRAILQIAQDGHRVIATAVLSTGAIIHDRIAFGQFVTAWDNHGIGVPYSFSDPGTYNISLVVVDKWGRVAETYKTITIE